MPGAEIMRGGGRLRNAMNVIEHLLLFGDRDIAEEVAADLASDGFTELRVVRQALAGEDDAEAHEWAVYIRDERTGVDEDAERARLADLAHEYDGWYDASP